MVKGARYPGITLQQLNSALPPRDLAMILLHIRGAHDLTEVRDRRGNSLLHAAAYGGRPDAVRLLLEEGIPPDVTNHLGMTPLHYAYAGHFCEVAAVLKGAGADPYLTDTARRTPLDMTGASVCNKGVKKGLHSPPPPPPPPEVDPASSAAWNRYVESGWYSGIMRRGLGRSCDLAVRNSSMSTGEFLTQYLGTYTPVLIQGLTQSWLAWDHWSYHELLKRQVYY